MKQLIIILFSCLAIGPSVAQTIYQSPHVKDGKTLQLTLPDGYFEVENTDLDGYSVYATERGLDFIEDNVKELPIGMIVFMHIAADEKTFETFIDDFENRVIERNAGTEIVGQPEILEINGRDCMLAGLKGELEGKRLEGLYFGVVQFGDYYMIASYYAIEGTPDFLEYTEFKEIMNTITEVETDKKNGMDELDFEASSAESYRGEYKNDMFETKLTSWDIHPEQRKYWMATMQRNSHLLAEFVYRDNKGFVKVFSGSDASNYASTMQMGLAIQMVIGKPGKLELVYDSEFSNDYHIFDRYTISSGGEVTSVYTTVVKNELVFFVVVEGLVPVDDFEPAVNDLMLTMQVDSFAEETKEEK